MYHTVPRRGITVRALALKRSGFKAEVLQEYNMRAVRRVGEDAGSGESS